MASAPTLRDSTTVILYIDFCVIMYTYTSLLRQILEYYKEFANDLAINFNNWCYIGEVIAVGASYLTIVASQKTTRAYRVNFLGRRPSRRKTGCTDAPFRVFDG